jgi:hypothetical protein
MIFRVNWFTGFSTEPGDFLLAAWPLLTSGSLVDLGRNALTNSPQPAGYLTTVERQSRGVSFETSQGNVLALAIQSPIFALDFRF